MSVPEELPDMDEADLLGLLFQNGENGPTEDFFYDDNGLFESWLSEPDVSHCFKSYIYFLRCIYLHIFWIFLAMNM